MKSSTVASPVAVKTTHPVESEERLSKDREARAQVTLTLKDEPLSGVLYTTTSAEAWKRLSERYEGKGKQSITYRVSKFSNMLWKSRARKPTPPFGPF